MLGAVAGHAAAGMSRDDLKELGEQLKADTAAIEADARDAKDAGG